MKATHNVGVRKKHKALQHWLPSRTKDEAIMLITPQNVDGDEVIMPQTVISEEGLGL